MQCGFLISSQSYLPDLPNSQICRNQRGELTRQGEVFISWNMEMIDFSGFVTKAEKLTSLATAFILDSDLDNCLYFNLSFSWNRQFTSSTEIVLSSQQKIKSAATGGAYWVVGGLFAWSGLYQKWNKRNKCLFIVAIVSKCLFIF